MRPLLVRESIESQYVSLTKFCKVDFGEKFKPLTLMAGHRMPNPPACALSYIQLRSAGAAQPRECVRYVLQLPCPLRSLHINSYAASAGGVSR